MGTQRLYNGGASTASEQVVDKVAQVRGESQLSLRPLYDTLDPDALDSLMEACTGECEVNFEYSSCLVAVRPGKVTVRRQAD